MISGFLQDENIEILNESAKNFLTTYGTPGLMGEAWAASFENVIPENRFDTLLSITGFASNPSGFFTTIGKQIKAAVAAGQPAEIRFQHRILPPLFLYHILEVLDPGQSLINVNHTEKLEHAVGFPIKDHKTMQAVLDQYPVRLSQHVIRQSMVSKPVAAQYLPFVEELGDEGHTMTFEGHFRQGLMEQMYQNRAIFLLDMRCPVYCRFCFRKHKSLRKEASPSLDDVACALDSVQGNPNIKEILITGGEPLLNLRNLEASISGLLDIDHIQTIRIATRSLAYYPHLFLHHGNALISRLKVWQTAAWDKGKFIEVGLHMIHPDEVSVDTLELIAELTASGIPVYVQTPFLKGVNDTGEILGRLFTLLRHAGAEIYYIFTPCHPIHGTRKYWSPINLSIASYTQLRAIVSDRMIPKLCTATPLGKIEWHTSGWAVAPDRTDKDHIWIRTPYTRKFFKAVVQNGGQLPEIRENKDGTLNVKCLIDMGDPSFFLGRQGLSPAATSIEPSPIMPNSDIEAITASCFELPDLFPLNPDKNSLCNDIRHVHYTRLEAHPASWKHAMVYLAEYKGITDIILRLTGTDIDRDIDAVKECIEALGHFGDRPFCIRLRWQAFQQIPGHFSDGHMAHLTPLVRFSPARPRRLEIESWWLTPKQVTQAHRDLGRSFLSQGIPVYGNMVLLSGLNDVPEITSEMAVALREARIDFHQVYVSGVSVQKPFKVVTDDRVTAIASHVRMTCSGREIPLYVRWTDDGEKDFGL